MPALRACCAARITLDEKKTTTPPATQTARAFLSPVQVVTLKADAVMARAAMVKKAERKEENGVS